MPSTDSSPHHSKPTILKDTREAKGLTLEIVHEATKIPLDALKAIEEGYSSRILSPFYYRGFIKIYSDFLGLDVKEMYRHYGVDEPAKPVAAVTAPPKLKSRPQPKNNLFLEQAQEWLTVVFKPQNIQLILKIAGVVVLVVLFFKMAGCVAGRLHHKKPAAPRHTMATTNWQQTKPVAAKPAVREPVVEPAPVVHQSVPAQSATDKVEVAVRASRDTWISVKTDDKVVYQATLPKGSLETWTADDRIELSGRNLQQLEMEVNYKQIGFLGAGERRIKKVLITKEGLTVKK